MQNDLSHLLKIPFRLQCRSLTNFKNSHIHVNVVYLFIFSVGGLIPAFPVFIIDYEKLIAKARISCTFIVFALNDL